MEHSLSDILCPLTPIPRALYTALKKQCQPGLTWVAGEAQARISAKSWLWRFCFHKSGGSGVTDVAWLWLVLLSQGSGVTDVVPSFQLAVAPGTPAHFSKQVARLPPVSSIVPQAGRIK